MRKIALLIIMTVCGLSQVHAQDFGVKAGYNYSTFRGETSSISTIEGLSGFYIGGLVELPISDVLSIQPELIFSRQGVALRQELKGFGLNVSINNADIRLDYLNIPVMAKVNLGPLFLQGGVQFGFLVGKPELGRYITNVRVGTLLDKDSYNSFDFGVGAGLGFNFNRRFFAEARYTHSLTNVFDPNDDYFKASGIGSNNNNFKNAVLSIGLGMKF
ncbi:porin family protein [uncultured Capnocytophaga sp.]|uniref:porin family protein n=1 Tax=uncultured Capnocytophaga sp. TaxID=159273 RepID=UPI0026229F51|nr:porin family protein [uncultured Capnocytophaga sp.]